MEQNNSETKQHKRRVRYKGKYPRKFSEKYKEHNPEKYADTVEKVISKGSTPAGMHIPIMVNEILDFFQIKPGMHGLDVTLGYGGHSGQMLKQLKGEGHLYALDVDPIESVKTKERLAQKGYGEEILTIKQMNFAQIDELMKETRPFDFILADLGVSSMQIDDPQRGFSYKNDGPLDLRLNPNEGIAASQLLQNLSQEELAGMMVENSDEPYAEEIAKTIVADIKAGMAIDTTMKLHNEIEKALEDIVIEDKKDVVKKSSARVFQALRIDVNREFEVLYEFLAKLPEVLAPGGKIAILTFHSGEDRLVKKAFKEYQRQGIYEEIAKDVIRPSKEECFRNSRAHSTKMRWAIKAQ
ncbi:16S rRNA (cytosine(1402)-N(4))-methyltransferase RsmH [Pectinatus brassicae]|uniref:Ribosomal RNA small subunit methyltransferase H n=1 Tax=Pectinatus brassicae TaxID=862415 RepID=A0A840USE1_9FIRM|nr:16S rRNA (cytosine(1402)-N(4))-methyltransferase RsmH [Pectinatus brassicae]MBB5337062.1 16S rRNA (cytosine1402-N4)-methyltransferase [Pectinatus brassicae]